MSKPGVDPTSGISSGDVLILPSGIRHVDGAKLNWAFVWNVRTWLVMVREKAQAALTARPKVPMHRRGTHCHGRCRRKGRSDTGQCSCPYRPLPNRDSKQIRDRA